MVIGMPDPVEQPHSVFVIRLWWERRLAGPQPVLGWYGRIEHVQSGETAAFRDPCRLLAFIERFVAITSDAGRAGAAEDGSSRATRESDRRERHRDT